MKKVIYIFLICSIQMSLIVDAEMRIADWERVMNLDRDTKVSVQMTNGEVLNGRIGDAWKEGLSLFTEGLHIVRLSKEDVFRVWKVRSRDKKAPVLAGVLVGGTAGYILGKKTETDADRAEDPGIVPLIWTITGSIGGAIIGLILTAARNPEKKEEVIYQSDVNGVQADKSDLQP